jgi:hypothetical protein
LGGRSRAEIVLTNLVQLNGVKLRARFGQQLLRGIAVWAVALGEDGDRVLVDDGLDFGLGGGHVGGRGAREERAQERYGCGCEGFGSGVDGYVSGGSLVLE